MSNYRVTRFNHLCGNAPSMGTEYEWWKQVRQQAERIKEEAEELYEAAWREDLGAVLDGYLDVKYTNEYMDDLLTANNVKTQDAFTAVCDNNDSKFTNSYTYACDSQQFHENKGVPCYIESVVFEGETWYCIRRNEDGKVLKPKHFSSVDLTPYLPKHSV